MGAQARCQGRQILEYEQIKSIQGLTLPICLGFVFLWVSMVGRSLLEVRQSLKVFPRRHLEATQTIERI
jgi:hypothetical protein